MFSKFMPEIPGIAVGTARIAAQPANLRPTSPCREDSHRCAASKAKLGTSRKASIVSLTRRAWSSASLK